MNRFLLLFLLSILTFNLSAQLTEKETRKALDAMHTEINSLRQKSGLKPLTREKTVETAAETQAEFLQKNKKPGLASSENKLKKTKYPIDRIKVANGDFEEATELLGVVSLSSGTIEKDEFDQIVSQFLTTWTETEEGNGLLSNQYDHVGYAMSINTKTKELYLLIVMARKGVSIDGQLSENGFGLKKSTDDCAGAFGENMIVNLSNSLFIEGNQVILKYHNKDELRTLFPDATDGIAIDLVQPGQFECGQENLLDRSPIYDGILLQPVYRDAIFGNNSSEGDFRLITVIGTLPEQLVGYAVLPNLIYLRKGKVCSYHVPAYIEADDYGLAPIEPLFDIQSAKLSETGSVRIEVVKYAFERAKTNPLDVPKVDLNPNDVLAIEIISYSSVEGDSASNHRLHHNRGKVIRENLEKQMGPGKYTWSTKVSENWDLCYTQLELLGLDSIQKLPKAAIRQYVITDKTHNWDSLLFIQRVSMAVIHIKGKRDSIAERNDFLNMNIRTALLTGNSQQANLAMRKLYETKEIPEVLLEPAILDRLKTDPTLVQNAAALLTNYPNLKNIELISFVRHWLRNPETISKDAQSNLIHLYALTTRQLLSEWDIYRSTLAKVLHPNKLEHFFSKRNKYDGFFLNYYLTSLSYYGQINDYPNASNAFDSIGAYFKTQSLNLDEEIKLCKFFNLWSRYDLTIDVMLRRMDRPGFSPKAAMLLAETITAYRVTTTAEQQQKAVLKAFELSRFEWCEWLDMDFQLLRDRQIKRLYCEKCAEE